MSNWKSQIEGLLRDEMRFCMKVQCSDDSGYVAVVDEEEFAGPADGSASGFLDHVIDLVHGLMKQKFMEGYASGVVDAISDLASADKGEPVEFSPEINKITAERRFMEVDK